ncbi:MAG TPA: DUF5681 domain-containing protein [Candidatus Acidoferrales bacterium]|nr:DUF5681 domain-containing protein [Candidatus Acidoferrales bacterium]
MEMQEQQPKQEPINKKIGHRFQLGVSGNPKGRPPKRLFDEHLKQALTAKRCEKAKLLAQKLIERGAAGNVGALKLICERVGGKPKTAEQVATPANEVQTLEQVRAKLAQLLADPSVRRNLQAMLSSSEKPEIVQ